MVTHQKQLYSIHPALEALAEQGFEGMAEAIQLLLNESMKLERDDFLQAEPYERSDSRRGHANGFKPKVFNSRLGKLDLQVPQVRGVEDRETFYPNALERGERSEKALKLALAQMYVQGVSTRKVKAITKKLCGLEITSSQVSRIAKELDEELEKWRNRPLGPQDYLVIDARYEKVRHGGSVISFAVLLAIGVSPEGIRSVLGVGVALSEAEVNWREFFSSLKERGLHGLKLISSDDHEGLKAALRAVFPGVRWQRCQVHLQRNAGQHVPSKEIRKCIGSELRGVFDASEKEEAKRRLGLLVKKYEKKAPKLSLWLEENIPEGFNVFDIPEPHRRRLRSTNSIERLNREILRRTRVVSIFPNEASLLRLVTAIVVETSEEWETGRRYLPRESD